MSLRVPAALLQTGLLLLATTAFATDSAQPDWLLGPFSRPAAAQPVIRPNPASVFFCPMRGEPVHWEKRHTFNPAAVVKDGKIFVLYRAEDDRSVSADGQGGIGTFTSRLGLAVSNDGLKFRTLPAPVLFPASDEQKDFEWTGGCEDPRIAERDDGTYVLTYTQYAGPGQRPVRLGLATSRDLVTWTKHGSAFAGTPFESLRMKSAAIVHEVRDGRLVAAKIDGKYWMYFGEHSVGIATSPDLIHWTPLVGPDGQPLPVLQTRPGFFDSGLTEVGPQAVRTDRGIVLIFNGKNQPHAQGGDPALPERVYSCGQALFDRDHPEKLRARTDTPFFKPELPWEKSGQYVDGTTFAEGLVLFQGRWLLYYGCADTFVGVATAEAFPTPAPLPVTIDVDLGEVRHTMAGGIGASWHAMGADVDHFPDLIGRDNRACKGSAYGGNPPVLPAFDRAWDDVRRHARWLGLDFVRVEVAMEMFAPERGRFDWDNAEMQTLYRILDHCQAEGVDVYFTMQWNGVAWNAHPGINRLQSAPRSDADFAVCYATLLEHLVKSRGYSCIHWITVNNEPGMGVGWWQGPDGKPASIMPAVRATRAELDKRGLGAIALCGSDGHNIRSGSFEPSDPAVGALAIHSYWGKPAEMFAEGTRLSAELRRPFFVAEMGTFFMGNFEGENMAMGGPRSEAPKSYAHQLINAEKIVGGLNLGVDGFSRWSFVNRGDLDGQWQLIRTWNPNTWDFRKTAEPEPVPYYTFGIITRFVAKHSAVLATRSSHDRVLATTLRSPSGQITLLLLNLANTEAHADLRLAGAAAPLVLRRYQVTESEVNRPGFALAPLATHTFPPKESATRLILPPASITTLTTYDLPTAAPGAIRD